MPLRLGILVAALLTGGAVAAETVVWFADGRTMTVESLRVEGDVVLLNLAGGGRLAVPADRVDRHDLVPPPVVVAAEPGESWMLLAGPYAPQIRRAAQRHGLDPALLAAVAAVESGFDPRAVSHKGAQGLLQLMPATARRFGVRDRFDPEQSAEGGARYLGWLLQRFSGDEQLALAGYNAGEGAVDRYSGVPPYPETEQYVDRVLAQVATLRAPAR